MSLTVHSIILICVFGLGTLASLMFLYEKYQQWCWTIIFVLLMAFVFLPPIFPHKFGYWLP